MRRPSLNGISPSWRRALGLLLVFVLWVAADRLILLAWPKVYRVVNVTTIHGTKGKGCEGYAGTYYALFGRPMGQADGAFHGACGQHIDLSAEESLYCSCE